MPDVTRRETEPDEPLTTASMTFKLPADYEPDFKRAAYARAQERNLNLWYNSGRRNRPKRFVKVTVSGASEDVAMFSEQIKIETLSID